MGAPFYNRRMRARFFLLLVFAACASPPKKPTNTCDCGKRVCGSVCGKSCGVCADDGVCSADGLTCRAALAVGAPCTTDLECGNGRLCLTGSQVPNGYCTRRCSAADPCPGSALCELGSNGQEMCFAACGASESCRTADGYQCDAGGYCPACVGSCGGRTCGDDGCGKSCGTCDGTGVVCDAGTCADDYQAVTTMKNANGQDDLRWDFAALPTDNGFVYLIGGRHLVEPAPQTYASAGTDEVTIYNPQDETFSSPPGIRLPAPVAHPNAALLGGVPYVVGGVTDHGDPATESPATGAWTYAGSSGSWTDLPQASAPQPSMYGALLAMGGKLWLLSGDLGGNVPSKRMDTYDPTTQSWSPAPDRPTARSHFAAVTDGQRIYVLGGWDGTKSVATVEIFDPGSGWSAAPDLPNALADMTAVVAGGRIFLFAGFDGEGPNRGDLSDVVQAVDLETHRTSLVGTTYDALFDQSPALARDGSVLLFGGTDLPNGTFDPQGEVVQFHLPAP